MVWQRRKGKGQEDGGGRGRGKGWMGKGKEGTEPGMICCRVIRARRGRGMQGGKKGLEG